MKPQRPKQQFRGKGKRKLSQLQNEIRQISNVTGNGVDVIALPDATLLKVKGRKEPLVPLVKPKSTLAMITAFLPDANDPTHFEGHLVQALDWDPEPGEDLEIYTWRYPVYKNLYWCAAGIPLGSVVPVSSYSRFVRIDPETEEPIFEVVWYVDIAFIGGCVKIA